MLEDVGDQSEAIVQATETANHAARSDKASLCGRLTIISSHLPTRQSMNCF